ncbi:MAG: glycosidase [Candidatus Pedobacter colombiensis]|uniref:Glycosidase n=1 Tax=Candidatus Pedobacter colombiensis TaxID=3121371 RepID=A0AAJ5W9S6_9SPHI|nr:glycosidase [Pedobacter sp.]WEK20345.1 MAG: glycosidase [Pedobacter sp.]
MNPFKLQRIGTIMTPEPGNELEVEGVLNPAAARGPDGALYLFPRLVAKNNYSRIGIVRVRFNEHGDPVGVERLGIALEPEADYEKRPNGGGGCEDPRITFVESSKVYVMTYTAFSSAGPRIALAYSRDLMHWERLGLATFAPYEHIEFNNINNKDACVFPEPVISRTGHPSFAMLHRPLFPGTDPEDIMKRPFDRDIREHHECIWISYCHIRSRKYKYRYLPKFMSNHPLAIPQANWENLKIGAGTPPVMTKHGWMMVYHGVSEAELSISGNRQLCYSAGVMILDKEQPTKVLYRSPEPVLSPDVPEEQVGMISNVVFPTGIDRRDDLGTPNRFDVYYGMADDRIGVARLDLPDELVNPA